MRALSLLLAAFAAQWAPRATNASRPPPPEIAVIVHPDTRTGALNKGQLEAIFSSGRRAWDGGRTIVAFTYPPDNELRRHFDRVVLGLTPEEVGRFWVDQRVRGGGRPPRQVPDPAMMRRLVGQVPGSIGFVPAALIDDTVKVVARVKDGAVTPP